MPNSTLSVAVARVGRAALAASPDPEASDGRLVARFAETGDGAAFAALVARHGPMVLAVCRRGAGDPHLADDAFQAAFLVLARRAAAVSPPGAVRPWLYGVAVRTARAARTGASRRRGREVLVPAVPDRPAPAGPAPDADALWMLDEEVARLPDRLRAAVVLCELDGVGRAAAAARLGVPEGTLSSRLAKARRVLAGRLAGRGVALAAVVAAASARPAAGGGVPPGLADAAATLAAPAGASAAVAGLARAVLRATLLKKLAFAAAVVVAVGVTAAGPVLLTARAEPAPVPATPSRTSADRIVAWNGGSPILIRPDGTGETRLPAPPEWADERGSDPDPVRLSPDGTKLLARGQVKRSGKDDEWALYVRPVDARGAGDRQPVAPADAGHAWWAADGTAVRGETWVYDLAGKKVRPAEPRYTALQAVAPNGSWSLIGRHFAGPPSPPLLYRVAGRGEPTRFGRDLPGFLAPPRISPDGKRVLFGADHQGPRRVKGLRPTELYVVEADGGKPARLELEGVDDLMAVLSCAWSPDGKRVAFAWMKKWNERPEGDRPAGGAANAESYLTVADADGTNPRTILAVNGRWLGPIDWR